MIFRLSGLLRRWPLWLAGTLAAAGLVFLAGRPPSLTGRDWAVDHALQPRIVLSPTEAHIEGLRDFRHHADGSFTEAYRDVSLPLDQVRGVWFALAPFAGRWQGLAHSFVSFELTGDRFLAISVEARREREESYSLLRGLLHGFEVTYVAGTEEDLIGLRALRGDTLFLYPSRATPQQARALLVDMLSNADALRTTPEFYNTLTNNCATILREHVNRVATEPLPLGWGVLFPGYSDELALEHGLLATDLPLARARERFRADELARQALTEGKQGSAFSRHIRGG